MQLCAAAVTSQHATTSDTLSPPFTPDMHPPPLSIATITHFILPIYYTTPPLHNLPACYLHPKCYTTIAFSCQLPTEFFFTTCSCCKPSSEYPISVYPTQPLQSSMSPLIPVQLQQQILQGECVAFAMLLLHRSKFSAVLEILMTSSKLPVIKRIASFDTWKHNPLAVEHFGYQWLICLANSFFLLFPGYRSLVLQTLSFGGTNGTLIFG